MRDVLIKVEGDNTIIEIDGKNACDILGCISNVSFTYGVGDYVPRVLLELAPNTVKFEGKAKIITNEA